MSNDSGRIVPFSNEIQWIPKDRPNNGLYPVEYYLVSQSDITALSQTQGSSVSPESVVIGSSGGNGPSVSKPLLQITGLNSIVTNQKTNVTFSVNAFVGTTDVGVIYYQWQKLESTGGDWFNILNATLANYTVTGTAPSGITYVNDNNDQYRCIVSNSVAVNSPLTSDAVLLSVNPSIISSALLPSSGLTNFNEGTSSIIYASASISNLSSPSLSYQWQKQPSGGSFSSIGGATSSGYTLPTLVFATDYNSQYRCIVSEPYGTNSPFTSDSIILNIRRVITITSQPTAAISYIEGQTATFTVSATITSGTISYQWQKKTIGASTFVDISSANSSSYTTPVFTINDAGTTYRCTLSNANADVKITNELLITIVGYDLEISPSVGGKTFWSFATDGVLEIIASTSNQTYTIIPNGNKTLISTLYGQGTQCSGNGGLVTGNIATVGGTSYGIKLNAGAGACGTQSGSSGCFSGGGYAGIFNSTTISQGNALLIAGGAGGGGAGSSQSCQREGGDGGGTTGSSGQNSSNSEINSTGGGGGSQSSGGAGGTADGSHTFSTQTTNTNSVSEGGVYLERSSGVDTYINTTGDFSSITHNNNFDFNFVFNTPYNDSNYSISPSTNGAYQGISANGSNVGGMHYSIYEKSNNGFKVLWFRDDDGSLVNPRYFSVSCVGSRSTGSNTSIGVNSNGSSGSALQGGTGGAFSVYNASNASGGGGGGGGYFGGGGGAGGNDYNNSTRDSSGGGGGSSYASGGIVSNSNITAAAGTVGANSSIKFQMPIITINTQPVSQTIANNATATFSVSATISVVSPAATLSYQWQKYSSGTWSNISLATSASYTTPTNTYTDSGTNYRVLVSTSYGNTSISNSATVTVTTPPTLQSFGSSPSSITPGSSSTLYWTVNNATSVSISSVGSVATSGIATVYPASTTTYTLTATGPGGTSTFYTSVTVYELPSGSFSSSPSSITSGSGSTLSWSISNATSVSISSVGTVATAGSTTVYPTSTTTYTLTATGPGGTSTFTASVAVTAACVPALAYDNYGGSGFAGYLKYNNGYTRNLGGFINVASSYTYSQTTAGGVVTSLFQVESYIISWYYNYAGRYPDVPGINYWVNDFFSSSGYTSFDILGGALYESVNMPGGEYAISTANGGVLGMFNTCDTQRY